MKEGVDQRLTIDGRTSVHTVALPQRCTNPAWCVCVCVCVSARVCVCASGCVCWSWLQPRAESVLLRRSICVRGEKGACPQCGSRRRLRAATVHLRCRYGDGKFALPLSFSLILCLWRASYLAARRLRRSVSSCSPRVR